MNALDRILGTEDVPPLHQCGRECADGSPCAITTGTIGETCHHHPEDAPRVDGGPEDPSEVPLSDVSSGLTSVAGATKGLVAGLAVFLGLGPVMADILAGITSVTIVAASAVTLNAYQRLAIRDDCEYVQN